MKYVIIVVVTAAAAAPLQEPDTFRDVMVTAVVFVFFLAVAAGARDYWKTRNGE